MKQLLGVGIAALLVLAGCGSGGTKTVTVTGTSSSGGPTSTTSGSVTFQTLDATTTSSATTSTATTTSSSSAVTATLHVPTFKSPSGNIGCMIIVETARCDIRQRSWSPPPKPRGCPSEVDFGQGLIVTSSGAGHFVCAGDTTFDPSAKTLPYHTETLVAGIRCTSAPDGMTCANIRSGHGFSIAIQGYRTF